MFGAYEELERNIVAKRKNSVEMVQEIKNIVCRYFVSCFSAPDTFELHNPYQQVGDGNPAALNANFGWPMGMPGMAPGSEDMGSHRHFTFSKMQDDLWESAKNDQFLMHKEFMNSILVELNDDPEAKTLFF